MRSILLAATCLCLGVTSAHTPTTSPTIPAMPPGPARDATGTLQVGQTWLLEGKMDRGRAFRAELTLGNPSAEERKNLEEGLRGRAGTARVTGTFTGVGQGPPASTFLALAVGQGGSEIVMVMPQSSFDPLTNEQAPELAEELAFCTLLPGRERRQFQKLALRSRGEGESYSATVAGTVGTGSDEQEQLLAGLRAVLAPIFGVGDCTLTRH